MIGRVISLHERHSLTKSREAPKVNETLLMPDPIVKHLAIIMDGNRRWAKERGLLSIQGHRAGYEALKNLGDICLARGIKIVTAFAFSTENWKRTQEEVGYLMDLLEEALTKELSYFKDREIRIRIIGRREGLRPSVLRAIENAEKETEAFSKCTLCLCVNYGGRPEIVDACKALVAEGRTADQIDEAAIQSKMYWPDMPDPELIIRTSGEERLSGFLLWQAAYSEFFWTKKHWPDFNEQELDSALESYAERQRRYGK